MSTNTINIPEILEEAEKIIEAQKKEIESLKKQHRATYRYFGFQLKKMNLKENAYRKLCTQKQTQNSELRVALKMATDEIRTLSLVSKKTQMILDNAESVLSAKHEHDIDSVKNIIINMKPEEANSYRCLMVDPVPKEYYSS
jgi:hypothetical protein